MTCSNSNHPAPQTGDPHSASILLPPFTPGQQNFLAALWSGNANSRSTVARALGLSKPTASNLASELLNNGIIEELGTGPSSGGKPPTLLQICPDAFHSLGIDIGYSNRIYGICMNAAGKIIAEQSLPNEGDFNQIVCGIEMLFRKLVTPGTMSAGIAISGIVDPLSGQIRASNNFDLADKPLRQSLQKHFSFPILLDNRSRTSAFAEHFQGAARQAENFILLSLGKSIGSAFFLKGSPYIGRCRAGEISELRVSGMQTLEECMTPQNILRQGLEESARLCAEGIFPLLSILDSPLLVLSGRFAELGPEFQELLSAEISRKFSCEVRPAKFGRLSASFGAAAEAVETFIFNKLY